MLNVLNIIRKIKKSKDIIVQWRTEDCMWNGPTIAPKVSDWGSRGVILTLFLKRLIFKNIILLKNYPLVFSNRFFINILDLKMLEQINRYSPGPSWFPFPVGVFLFFPETSELSTECRGIVQDLHLYREKSPSSSH